MTPPGSGWPGACVNRPRPRAIIEREGEPLDLIEEWAGADRAIVVDAVSSGAEPGTIHRLDAAEAAPADRAVQRLDARPRRGRGRRAGHGASDRLPETLLLVFGIEGGSFGAGAGLTPAVERAVGSARGRAARRY